MKKFSNAWLFGVSMIAIGAPSIAEAQAVQPQQEAQSGAEQGDIIVTAQKRSENVQKVPVAITVVGQEQLVQQQVNTVQDLKRTAPSLEFAEPGQSPGAGAYVRGLGTTLTSTTAEASVGLVVDGVTQGNIPQTALFDVERVEVLRGPQGTLFGQSVSAGLVNISSVAPKLGEFSGQAQFELAEDGVVGSGYSRRIGRLILNAPLGNDAALRISSHFDSIDDVSRNRATNQNSDKNDRGVRARLLWEPSNEFTFNLIADYNQVNTTNAPFLSYAGTTDPLLRSVLGQCGITVGPDNGDVCTPQPLYTEAKQFGISAQADIMLGDHTVTWISAYRGLREKSLQSIDGLPSASSASPFVNITNGDGGYSRSNQFTQEIRLTSPKSDTLEYVIGAFYNRFENQRRFAGNLRLFFLPAPIISVYDRSPVVESMAAFGQTTAHIGDSLSLIAGGRFTRNEVTSRTQITSAPDAVPGFYAASSTVNNFSWKLGAQYEFSPRLMAYSTIARGFKGQTYDDDSKLDQTPLYVRPEIPTSIEVGLKGRLFGRFNFDLNLFRTRVKDYQAQVCAPDTLRGVVCIAQNIDKVTTKGVELGIFGELLPGLNVNGGVVYVDAKYPAGFFGTDGKDLGGYQLANSARWKIVASGEYKHALNPNTEFFLGADTIYRSRVRFVTISRDDVTFKPHFITGARIGVRIDDGRYELAVFGRNLFDVREPTLRYDASQITAFTAPGSITTTQILTEAAYRVVGLSGNIRF